MRSLSVESRASGAYFLDIGHSSRIHNPARLGASALCDSAWMLHVLPLTASGQKGSFEVECAVRPPGRINAAMAVDAVHKTSAPRVLYRRCGNSRFGECLSQFQQEHRSCRAPPFCCMTLDASASKAEFLFLSKLGNKLVGLFLHLSPVESSQEAVVPKCFRRVLLGKPYLSVDLPCFVGVKSMGFRAAWTAAVFETLEAKSCHDIILDNPHRALVGLGAL